MARGTGKARGLSSRVVLRRASLDKVVLAVADGLVEAGRVIEEYASATAPDSPYDPYPTGEGLPKQGGILAYFGGKKIDGWSRRGPQPNKPRAARILTKEHAITVLVGFGFPGRFAERGTNDTPAQPFLAPSRDRLGVGGIIRIVGTVAGPKIGGMGKR